MSARRALAVAALTLLAGPAWAGEFRVGVFVGNDVGAANEGRLVFAGSDARKMHDVFVDLGGIANSDAFLLVDEPRHSLQATLAQVTERIARAEAAGDHTTLVFYYSGHGDEAGLQLGESHVGHDELRAWLEGTGADVRIAFLDSCRSGAAVRAKGGVRGPGYAFAVDVEHVEGTAILTSSASTEFSQESDEVGGGFFTYYLHTGLSGAADIDGDGVVTLDEAYRWVHTETAFRTRETPGTQTPSYDLDLAGSGSVPLTTLARASAHLAFPGGLDGTFAVWDESRKRYVAEVAGSEQTAIAVRAGVYDVHRREPGWVDEATYTLKSDQTATVAIDDFQSVAYEDTAARGAIAKEVRAAALPDLSVHVALGGRGFGRNSPYATQYVPQHAIAGIALEYRFTDGLWGGVDVMGGTGEGNLSFAQLGAIPVTVSSTSVGATLGLSPSWRLLRAGIGARAESVWFWRTFPDGNADRQTSWGIAPGLASLVGLHIGHWRGDLAWNAMILPVSWDGNNFPAYSVVTLRMGYAF